MLREGRSGSMGGILVFDVHISILLSKFIILLWYMVV